MKFIILSLISFSIHAQVVQNHFIKWSNEEVKSKIEDHNQFLLKSLNQANFSDKDTINVYFHLTQEYILVTSNITSSKMTDLLYKKMVLHFANMQTNFQYLRFYYFRILIRDKENRYYKTNYNTLSLTNRSHKLRDARILNHLSRNNVTDKYLYSSSLRR